MTLVIDLTDEDLKAGCHWLADKAPAEFERAPLPTPSVIDLRRSPSSPEKPEGCEQTITNPSLQEENPGPPNPT